jgi:hypothetical protein
MTQSRFSTLSFDGKMGIFVAIVLLSHLHFLSAPGLGQNSPQSRSIWNCLPEETAFAARIPNGKAFIDTFIDGTKLGNLILGEKRQTKLLQELNKFSPKKWSQWKQQLADIGLTTDEFLKLFSGETGYAIAVEPGDDDTPLALGLAWIKPRDALAERAYKMIVQAIEHNEDHEHPVSRIDYQLSDQEVMQLMLPQRSLKYPEDFDLPDNYDDLPVEDQRPLWIAAHKKWIQDAQMVVQYGTALVSSIGEEVVVVHSFRASESPKEHPDTERLTELLTRMLEDHATGNDLFLTKHSANPGVAQVMNHEGVCAIELLGDISPFLQFNGTESDHSETEEKIVRLLGTESLGSYAMRSTLNGNQFQTHLFLALSHPRQGLLQLCEQAPLSSAPPSWVPANAISCTQISFDLGKAYAILKEELLQVFPERFEKYFAMVEAQVQGHAKTGLEDLLGSLGTRHTIVNFEIEANTPAVDSETSERIAIVWQLQDESLWTTLMKSISPMVMLMPGGDYTDEQGYSGFRFKSDAVEGGLFLGNGNLVFAYGQQVLETTLSALNHPSEGADSFRGGAIYQQATAMLEPHSSLFYDVVDGARQARISHQEILRMFQQEETLDFEVDEAEAVLDDESMIEPQEHHWLELGKALFPTSKEIEGILGVIANRFEVDEDGLHGVMIQELPPPGER